MTKRKWLIVVYPYNGRPVHSYLVKCIHQPHRTDLRVLEKYLDGHVELKNLSAV